MERELARAEEIAKEVGGIFERHVDSVYLGGGTPSVLAPDQLATLFRSVRENFDVLPGSEITVEVAPGTLSPEILKVLLDSGVNRISLGMQSFVDQETRSVGRLHTRDITLADIASLRAAGIAEISLDLIAGLPHQTAESWNYSLTETIGTGVPHVSVYMLEVDEDSRLGRELIAGGTRYHAHHVPDDDLVADFYLKACETFNAAGLHQYEISNFARDNNPIESTEMCHPERSRITNEMCHPERSRVAAEPKDLLSNLSDASESALVPNASESALKGHGFSHAKNIPTGPSAFAAEVLPSHASRHNLKYWLRHPYLGFGVDAHSMLCAPRPGQPHAAVRLATTDNLDALLAGAPLTRTEVAEKNALEETFFLGLRLSRGIDLNSVTADFGADVLNTCQESIAELTANGLLTRKDNWLRLTDRGRLLSNEIFAHFLIE